MTGITIVAVLAALGLGGALGWIFRSARSARQVGQSAAQYIERERYEELRSQYAQTQEALRSKIESAATLTEANRNLAERNAAIQEEQTRIGKHLQAEFENLANRILDEKSRKFVGINEVQVAGILRPLQERLQSFEKKVQDTYTAELREQTSLRTELRMLMEQSQKMSADANNLTRALKGDSKAQGDWGEALLEVLLENSGLQRDIHYQNQLNFKTEEGANQRPDCIIKLPEGRSYIIDSKVSLTHYYRYVNAADDEERKSALAEHLRSLQRHIADLSSKNYQTLYGINSPDFVFLFVAVEPALTLAMQADFDLQNRALRKNIAVVSQTTLLSTLKMSAFIWRQADQGRNAQEIARTAGALYDKFVGFTQDLENVGRTMLASKNAYDDAMRKLVSSTRRGDTIVGRVETLRTMGASAQKTIPQAYLDRAAESEGISPSV